MNTIRYTLRFDATGFVRGIASQIVDKLFQTDRAIQPPSHRKFSQLAQMGEVSYRIAVKNVT